MGEPCIIVASDEGRSTGRHEGAEEWGTVEHWQVGMAEVNLLVNLRRSMRGTPGPAVYTDPLSG